MKIALVLDYHDLQRLAKLFAMLYEHFPNGWLSFEMHGKLQPEVHPILWLKEALKPEDNAFLDSLKAPFLTGPNPEPRHDVIRYWEVIEQPQEAQPQQEAQTS